MPIILTFMNSKLTKMTEKDKQNLIFQKSKSCEISSKKYRYIYIYIYINIYIYIYIGEDLGIGIYDQEFIHIFYWCIPLDHEIYTK